MEIAPQPELFPEMQAWARTVRSEQDPAVLQAIFNQVCLEPHTLSGPACPLSLAHKREGEDGPSASRCAPGLAGAEAGPAPAQHCNACAVLSLH